MSYIGAQPTTAAFVTDTFSANGSGTVFTLSVAPANTNSILVAVSGVLQDPSTYSVSGTTLTFSAAPPAGTGNISVRFLGIPASGVTSTAYRTQTEFTATAGQTTFSVPSYTVGYIDVYRNGAKLGSADFTATTGTTVVLASGASSGDLIQTVSFYVSSVLNAIPATANAVTTSYINDGAVTQAKLGTGVAGNGPTFSAAQTSNQSYSSNASTLIQFQSENWDTASCFNNTNATVGSIPAYAFLPNVAGYYQVNLIVRTNNTNQEAQASIYKNGSAWCNGSNINIGSGTQAGSTASSIVYLNGTTDYIQGYVYTGSSGTGSGNNQSTQFSAVMVRGA
jgi:hypothetical protein